ncbi:hypothetical protein ABFX02_08G184800 [Erythranthe guttata]
MAERSRTMIVTNIPHKTWEYYNVAYCSNTDFQNFRVPEHESNSRVLIGDALVLRISGSSEITSNGHIALNPFQRRYAKAFYGDSVSVTKFVPPENFNLALLTLELELVKKDEKDELVDAILISTLIHGNFFNQVMTTGQRVFFQHNSIGYIFTVNQAVLEGRVKTKNGIERGMISTDTRIILEAPMSSGVQIFNQRVPTGSSSNTFKNKEFNCQPFGTVDLECCRPNGIMECGPRHDHVNRRTSLLAEQVKVSEGSPLVTCLLEGPSGSGKTAMAATVGIESDFPFVKIISAETMVGLGEPTKCAQIIKVFEDAYESPLSIIILDDIERYHFSMLDDLGKLQRPLWYGQITKKPFLFE